MMLPWVGLSSDSMRTWYLISDVRQRGLNNAWYDINTMEGFMDRDNSRDVYIKDENRPFLRS